MSAHSPYMPKLNQSEHDIYKVLHGEYTCEGNLAGSTPAPPPFLPI